MSVREHARARKLKLPDYMSLARFVLLTKRSRPMVENAIEHLGIKLRHSVRIDPRQRKHPNQFIVRPEEQATILAFLAQLPRDKRIYKRSSKKTDVGVWGIGEKPVCCHECGTSQAPHFARGFCKRCYGWIVRSRKREKNPWNSTRGPSKTSTSRTER